MEKSFDQKLYHRLLEYALGLCARKRYTVQGIREKLEKKSDQQEELKKVLARLEELRYLDDAAYSRDYAADRIRFKPRGKRLIKLELLRKGIDKHLVEETVEGMRIDESEAAERLLKKKNFDKFNDRHVIRNKAYQYLAGKGFNLDSIYKAIDRCYG